VKPHDWEKKKREREKQLVKDKGEGAGGIIEKRKFRLKKQVFSN